MTHQNVPPQSSPFVFTMFTNDVELARRADAAGVDRIGVDLEKLGKQQRQAGLNTWVSDHTADDFARLVRTLSRAAPFVRTNPMHSGLAGEVDGYLESGARVLMLPMFRTADEARRFVDIVAGRATVSLLVETPAAAVALHEIVAVEGVDEIHIGLNDLRLAMGLRTHFAVLASDLMDSLAATVRDAGVPLGIGGVGRVGDTGLPVRPDLVFAQLCRLGATRSLISRAFFPPDPHSLDMVAEMSHLRQRLDDWRQRSPSQLLALREELRQTVRRQFPSA